jgi:putative phage-type endonuclease
MVIKHDIQQGSDEWFAVKAGKLSASVFSILMSGTETAGYKKLLLNIAAERITGIKDKGYSSPAMQRGVELEKEAVEFYEAETESTSEEVGFVTNLDVFPDWVGVSPDRLIENGVLEVKCPLAHTHIDYLRKNKLPNAYKWQVQGQMLVAGVDFAHFVSYYPNLPLLFLRVEKDEAMQEHLKERMKLAIDEVEQIIKEIT